MQPVLNRQSIQTDFCLGAAMVLLLPSSGHAKEDPEEIGIE
jgi:hypothetical protein